MTTQLVVADGGAALTDSQIIAKALGLKHAYVMRVVNSFFEDYPDLRVIQDHPKKAELGAEYIRIEPRSYRGAAFQAAVMNREAFTLLFTRFETPKARQLQRDFNRAFYEMERRLASVAANADDLNWVGQRRTAVIARRHETEVIQRFVQYATEQGSKHAEFYYKHITNATYKAIGLLVQRKPKLRDALSIYELSQLMLLEYLAMTKLEEYMNLGRNYKDIYESVASDLLSYGESIKMPFNKLAA